MVEIVSDSLNHEAIAKRIAIAIHNTKSEQSTIGLFGRWGRGKTDTLSRLTVQLKDDSSSNPTIIVNCNPWESGYQDIISCIAHSLYKLIPSSTSDIQKLKSGLKKTAIAGSIIANRAISHGTGIDIGQLVDEVKDSIEDPIVTIFEDQSPVEFALKYITEILGIVAQNSKAVFIIDDIDRCPPSWQQALFESIYFLKRISHECVFVLSMDKVAIMKMGEENHGLGSLCSKLFDMTFELPDDQNLMSEYARDLLTNTDDVIELSVADALTGCFKTQSAFKPESINGLVNGLCFSEETSNPRCILRVISRVRSIILSKSRIQTMPNNHSSCFGFMAGFAIRETWPELSIFLFKSLPQLLSSASSGTKEQMESGYKKLTEEVSKLPVDLQSVVIRLIESQHVEYSNHYSLKNKSEITQLATGLEVAYALSKKAFV